MTVERPCVLCTRPAVTAFGEDDLCAQHADRDYRVFEDINRSITPEAGFLMHVLNEVLRARRKFPGSEANLAALSEEAGEVARACLDQTRAHVIAECVQLAAMACRVATEGDPTLNGYRTRNGLEPFPCRPQTPTPRE